MQVGLANICFAPVAHEADTVKFSDWKCLPLNLWKEIMYGDGFGVAGTR
jgi:hypothetical protein